MKKIASLSLLALAGVLFAGCASQSDETCKPGDMNAKPVAGAVNAVCPVGGDDATHSNVTTSYKGSGIEGGPSAVDGSPAVDSPIRERIGLGTRNIFPNLFLIGTHTQLSNSCV